VAKSHPPMLIVGWRNNDVDHFTEISLLDSWVHLFILERWGCFLVRGVWFPSHMLLEGTDRIQEFWALASGPRYLG
jgi:hypothetical protein